MNQKHIDILLKTSFLFEICWFLWDIGSDREKNVFQVYVTYLKQLIYLSYILPCSTLDSRQRAKQCVMIGKNEIGIIQL